MALIKVILGFLLGLLLCGVLLFLISVRSPVQTGTIDDTFTAPSKIVADSGETNDSGEMTAKKKASEAETAVESVVEAETEVPTKVEMVEEAAKAEETTEDSSKSEEMVDSAKPEEIETTEPVAPQTDVATPKPADSGDSPNVIADSSESQTRKPVAGTAVSEDNSDLLADIDEILPSPAKPNSETVVEAEPEEAKPEQKAEEEAKPDTEVAVVTPKPSAKLPTIGGQSNSRIKLSSEANAPTTEKTFGAFELNAAQFSGAEGPLMAIVLVDVGSEGVAREKLAKLEFPATIAVPADQAGALNAIKLYRESDKEVLLEAPSSAGMSLTSGIGIEDQRALLTSFIERLPGAVGLIDNPLAEIQKNRRILKMVLETFETSGHAIVSFDKGLNSTAREAAKLNVPAGEVFRVLDDDGAEANQIERILKRAIIQANQEGGTVVLAHSRPETLKVLTDWIETGGADGVRLAPVSAVIRKIIN